MLDYRNNDSICQRFSFNNQLKINNSFWVHFKIVINFLFPLLLYLSFQIFISPIEKRVYIMIIGYYLMSLFLILRNGRFCVKVLLLIYFITGSSNLKNNNRSVVKAAFPFNRRKHK
jgi:hypothetical protein